MTIDEAFERISHFVHYVDLEGRIRTIGGGEPPAEAIARLEAAGYGTGGEEWRRYLAGEPEKPEEVAMDDGGSEGENPFAVRLREAALRRKNISVARTAKPKDKKYLMTDARGL